MWRRLIETHLNTRRQLRDVDNKHRLLNKISCVILTHMLHHIITKTKLCHCLKKSLSHVTDASSHVERSHVVNAWQRSGIFPHVPLMWFLCKHIERTDQQPLIILVGDASSCFLWQVSSSLFVRQRVYLVLSPDFNPEEHFFNLPHMWHKFHQTIMGFSFLFFSPIVEAASLCVFNSKQMCVPKKQQPNRSFQSCRLQIPRQVWPAVTVQYEYILSII